MKKEEFIERRGEAAWERKREKSRVWYKQNREQIIKRSRTWQKQHPKQSRETSRIWRKRNPIKITEKNRKANRKGGPYYAKKLKAEQTGLRGERNKIRNRDAMKYRPYKLIIAPASQIHHQWQPKTSKYSGVALVEKEQHQYGIIDVIQILDGDITLLTEKEIREQ